jgi:hypothetical protein
VNHDVSRGASGFFNSLLGAVLADTVEKVGRALQRVRSVATADLNVEQRALLRTPFRETILLFRCEACDRQTAPFEFFNGIDP